MQQSIAFVQQAGAAFYTRHFVKAVYLLRRALQVLPRKGSYSRALRWALLDGVEMVESWYLGLPSLEQNSYSQQLLEQLQQQLAAVAATPAEQQALQQTLKEWDQLLQGLWVVFDFFDNNNLSLEQDPLLVSVQLLEGGAVELFSWQDNPLVRHFVKEFEACFAPVLEQAEDYEQAVEELIAQQDFEGAEALLQEQLERFPSQQRLAFLQLGELYFQQQRYQKAMEAYMKAVVMGTPKAQIRPQAQTACNALAREADNSKAAERWRKVLIDFF